MRSLFRVDLPCCIAGKNVKVSTDVVNSPIPLLLSKTSMKKANSLLDFTKDTVSFFGKKMKLQCTSSGHYYINLTHQGDVKSASEILFMRRLHKKSEVEKKKIAEKLHRQFSHPSSTKLSLVKSSGVKDKGFLRAISEVPSDCETCLRYKKNKPRPIVGMPLASTFNELVAIDIKEIRGNKVLHMIDHATRYSVASLLSAKKQKI